MKEHSTKQELGDDRRKWLRRAMIGLPVGALVLSSLQNIKDVHAAPLLNIGASNAQTSGGNTTVTLTSGNNFQLLGNYAVASLGLLTVQNSNSSGHAIMGWATSGTGVGIVGIGPTCGIYTPDRIGVGISQPERSIHLQDSDACFRMDRDVDSSAFIITRTAPGDFSTIWKTFYVGVNATGVNHGEFFIGDVGNKVSGASLRRLWITNSGAVHIPNLVTGDITMANDFIVTEDYEKTGIAFKNDSGEKIAILDKSGNLHIKGDVIKDL